MPLTIASVLIAVVVLGHVYCMIYRATRHAKTKITLEGPFR
jgi:hypothetical protein